MKAPQWHDVLEPPGAVIAGVVGFAVVCRRVASTSFHTLSVFFVPAAPK
jgi:hypothetical protein